MLLQRLCFANNALPEILHAQPRCPLFTVRDFQVVLLYLVDTECVVKLLLTSSTQFRPLQLRNDGVFGRYDGYRDAQVVVATSPRKLDAARLFFTDHPEVDLVAFVLVEDVEHAPMLDRFAHHVCVGVETRLGECSNERRYMFLMNLRNDIDVVRRSRLAVHAGRVRTGQHPLDANPIERFRDERQ